MQGGTICSRPSLEDYARRRDVRQFPIGRSRLFMGRGRFLDTSFFKGFCHRHEQVVNDCCEHGLTVSIDAKPADGSTRRPPTVASPSHENAPGTIVGGPAAEFITAHRHGARPQVRRTERCPPAGPAPMAMRSVMPRQLCRPVRSRISACVPRTGTFARPSGVRSSPTSFHPPASRRKKVRTGRAHAS